MKWSYRIARIAGIDVRIHITFLLLPLYFGWVGWQSGGPAEATRSVLFILLLFICVLLHEFGHALAGRYYGVSTPDITLLPIGGVARMLAVPDKPKEEFVIAVAGPAVNVVIAVVLAPVLWLSGGLFSGPAGETREILHNLLLVNLGLVVFNMIPAFPMDGGRIFRSLLAMKIRWTKATRIAGRTGQVLAGVFCVGGFLQGNFMLMLIAIFVFNGAQDEIRFANYRDDLERQPPPLPPEDWFERRM
jgi:stage IV sporulation protein FB